MGGRNTARIPSSALIAAYPRTSGLGVATDALWRLGFFQDFVLFKTRRRQSEDGYPHVVKSPWNSGGLGVALSLYGPSVWSRAISRYKVVHFGSPHFFHLAKYVPDSTGTVYDLLYLEPSLHGSGWTYGWFYARAMRHISRLRGVVVISYRVAEQLKTHFPSTQPTVIHPWTTDEFRERDRGAARRALGLPSDGCLLLSVGADSPRKNLDILPRIAERLPPEYTFVRVGPSERIESRFRRGGLIWASQISADLYPLYFNAVDALVMPSRSEGFGIPIIEAINSNLPVIAADIPIFRELLGENYPLLADPDDPSEWVGHIRALGAGTRPSPNEYGRYGRLKDYYRAPRARNEFEAFFRESGEIE